MHKVAPAIAAGCAVVVKPAEKTPLSSLWLAGVAREAGLPDGYLNVVVGKAADIAGVLCDDPRVRLITFTGSTAIGQGLRMRARHARVTLELGNATPVVVCADADVPAAATLLGPNGFTFAGQTCVSVQRLYVHEDVYDEFVGELLGVVDGIRAGDPEDPDVTVGPVITAEAHDRLLEWIDEAVEQGARVLRGGSSMGNNVIEPTVLEGVTLDMQVGCKEAFGPLVTLTKFRDLDDAFAQANGTDYGLQAAVFTASLDTALRASAGLEFGSVLVNETPSFRADHMPYGGTKGSGNTKEGPAHAVLEMTEERLVVIKRPT
jgi:acyl-CoA reductase-like NAD-dependent aldehyde dehydrogenase